MNNYKKRLAELVYNSDLKDEDKILWVYFLRNATSEENEAVFEAVSESKASLKLLTEH